MGRGGYVHRQRRGSVVQTSTPWRNPWPFGSGSWSRGSIRSDDLVLDPFAGLGTTVIAAEVLGRRAACVELSPHYVDVICKRYQNFTGTKPCWIEGRAARLHVVGRARGGGVIAPELEPFAVDVDSLTELQGNPRRGDVEAVKRSYAAFMQQKPIKVQRRGSELVVIDGNHQLRAARELGWDKIAATPFVMDDGNGGRAKPRLLRRTPTRWRRITRPTWEPTTRPNCWR